MWDTEKAVCNGFERRIAGCFLGDSLVQGFALTVKSVTVRPKTELLPINPKKHSKQLALLQKQ